MRVVLDTNVLLSAFLTGGICDALIEAVLASEENTLVISEHILGEYARQAVEKFGASGADVRETLALLHRRAQVVEPADIPSGVCRDHDDLPVIGTAVAAGAEVIVTGDSDLLSLGWYGDILILSPRAFYERIR